MMGFQEICRLEGGPQYKCRCVLTKMVRGVVVVLYNLQKMRPKSTVGYLVTLAEMNKNGSLYSIVASNEGIQKKIGKR